MNILFIANLVPYPLDNGGKIKTFTTIQVLSQEYTVDLLCFYENENTVEARKALAPYCRNIVLLPIKVTTGENFTYMLFQAAKCFLSVHSLSVYKYHVKSMEESITNMMKKNKYELAYFNILQVYNYKNCIAKIDPSTKFVLDTQNCETQIFRRYAKESKGIIKKIYLKLECVKLKKFEAWAIRDADRVILLSEEDKQELESMGGKLLNGAIIPIGVNEPAKIKKIEKKDSHIDLLFLGTLTWAPNNEGLIWFISNVMPKLQENYRDFTLYIVGKNPSEQLRVLASKYSNVVITGYVNSVDEYYEKCDFMIVPLFIGSGQRVKIIESFSRGMPVISTSIGAEGLRYIDGNNIMIANTVDEFFDKLFELRKFEVLLQLSHNGRSLYEQFYSIDAVGRQIRKVVSSLENKENI